MKKKIVILLGLILVAGLLCPIHFADRQNKSGTGKTVRGLSLPWFNSFEDTPILLKSVDSVIWSYSDSITGTEIIKYEDSGTELKKHTRTESVRLFNKFTIWTKEEKIGYDQGVLYDWEEYEDRFAAIPRKDRVVPERIKITVSEFVFEQYTGSYEVTIEVDPENELEMNKVVLTEHETGEKTNMHQDEDGVFRAIINVDSDVATDDGRTVKELKWDVNNTAENSFSLFIVKSGVYDDVYVSQHLFGYVDSDAFVTDTDLERKEKLAELLESLKADGFISSYDIADTKLSYSLANSDSLIGFDFGEYGVRPYENDANEAVQ